MADKEDLSRARWEEQRRIRDEGMRREPQRREAERKAAQRKEVDKKEAIEKLLNGRTPDEKGRLLEGTLTELMALEEEARKKAKEDSPAEEERDQTLDTAIAWLSKKWGESTCPYCGGGPWEIAGPFSIPFGEGDGFLSPVFSVMCSNCGQTTFVNAIRAGAVPEPDQDDEEQ